MIIATKELRKLSLFFFSLALSGVIGGETTRADGSTEDHTASIECAAAAFFDYGRGCRAMRAMSPTNGQ